MANEETQYVALSTCQAEQVAMSDCCQEMISIHNCLKRVLDWDFTPVVLWCDNKEHHVRECVERKLVKVNWLASKRQMADVLTKPLSFDLHLNLIKLIMNI